jgi:excisionase family DNA binding protein
MNWFLRQIIKMSPRKMEIAKVTTEPRPKSDKEFRILTVRELAGYLRVHQTTVYRLLKEKKLPAFRVGADWRFNHEAIDRWMRGQQKRS